MRSRRIDHAVCLIVINNSSGEHAVCLIVINYSSGEHVHTLLDPGGGW